MNLSFLIPWLPFIGILLSFAGTSYLMGLQKKKLKKEIEVLSQNIENAKTTKTKDEASTLEILGRVTASTAEEIEKALQKSITLKNLKEQVDLQRDQITSQQEIINLQNSKISDLTKELQLERDERQKALSEIETLKATSDKVVKKWIEKVKFLESLIQSNGIQIPNCPDPEEDEV